MLLRAKYLELRSILLSKMSLIGESYQGAKLFEDNGNKRNCSLQTKDLHNLWGPYGAGGD